MIFWFLLSLLSAFFLYKNIKQGKSAWKILSGLFLSISLLFLLISTVGNNNEKKKETALEDYYSIYKNYIRDRDSDIVDINVEKKSEEIRIIYPKSINTLSSSDMTEKLKKPLAHLQVTFDSWKKTSDYDFKETYYPHLAFYDEDGNVIATTSTLQGKIYLK